MKKQFQALFIGMALLGLTACSSSASSQSQLVSPERTVLSPFRAEVNNENLLSQPRISSYLAEVKSVLPERYFVPPTEPGKNTESFAIYYTPVLVALSGSGSLNGTDQHLGLLSDSGWDYPIEQLTPGTQLVVFLVADPAPRSDGLSETAPSWVGYVDDAGMLHGLSPHDSVSLKFDDIRVNLGL